MKIYKIDYKNRYFPIWDYASAEVIFAPAETSAVTLGRPTRYRITLLLKRVATLWEACNSALECPGGSLRSVTLLYGTQKGLFIPPGEKQVPGVALP